MLSRKITFAMLVTFIVFAANAAPAEHPMRIVIDPGHGGHDTGACRGAIKESEIALQIAQDLRTLLNHDARFASLLTRDTDKFLTLEQRTAFAEKNNADLLVSIHANASPDHRAQGAEFYFQNLLGSDEESMFLASRENESAGTTNDAEVPAKSDLSQILDDLKRNRKLEVSSALSHLFSANWSSTHSTFTHRSSMVRQAPFFVVSQTSMPAVLIEVGFVSNSEEGPRLTTTIRQREIAQQLYQALIEFKKKSDNEEL